MTDEEYAQKQATAEAASRIDTQRPINAAAEFNDAYWLRMFYAAAIASANLWISGHKDALSTLMKVATDALAEIKKHEASK